MIIMKQSALYISASEALKSDVVIWRSGTFGYQRANLKDIQIKHDIEILDVRNWFIKHKFNQLLEQEQYLDPLGRMGTTFYLYAWKATS